VRFNQRLSAWFLVVGNEDREAFLGGLKILELPCPRDAIAGRKSHPFTDAPGSDFNIAADVGSSDVHKDEPDKLRVFIADRRRAGLVLISASIDMGTCAPVGVGTSTRLRESRSSRKSRA
jgi:hypothetical protein